MTARNDAHGIGSQPLRRARRFYAIAGVLAVGTGLMTFWSPFSAWLQGCAIFTSQESMDAGWEDGAVVELPAGCSYYLDVVGIVVPLVAGAVVLVGAWRYFRTDRASSIATAMAIPAGLLIAAVPAYVVWGLIDYYNLSIGPTELAFMAGAAAVLAWSLVSAWRTAQHLGQRLRAHVPQPDSSVVGT